VSRSLSAATSATLLGGALAAVAFASQPGTDLATSTVVLILAALSAGAVLGFLVLRGLGGPVHGGTAVLLLGLFTAITALSAAWSIAPSQTAEEAGQLFAYLIVFAAAVAAGRYFPRGAGILAGGIAAAGVIVCGWALATRIWPGSLSEDLLLTARLGAPFDYWNALGSFGALTLPAVLWLAARRLGASAVTAFAYPAMGTVMLVILLTQSRGALAAGLLGLVIWFVVVPLRLRSVPVLVLPALAVAPVAAWALSRDQFTKPFQPVAAQEAIAGDFGLLVVAMLVAQLAAGLAAVRIASRWTPSLRVRHRAGAALVAVACTVPLVAVAAVALGDRGLGSAVSDRFEELTSETQAPPADASRLTSASSSRGEYWRQAGKVFGERPLVGAGANTFGLARLPYRKDGRRAAHAHGFVAQTMSDLGLVGLVAAIGLLIAWLVAAARTLGLMPGRGRSPEWSNERIALAAIALSAVVFGLHSIIDWTWSIPGTALTALAAAGFVAGRGPVSAAPVPTRREGSTAATPARVVAAFGLAVTTLLCCWAIWQPQAAARANDRALDAIERGDFRQGEREADEARRTDRYSAAPLFVRATALAGQSRPLAAYRTLEQAVREHPRDPDTWLRLADYELRELELPQRALATLEGVLMLDPKSLRIQALLREVQAALVPPPPPPPAP